MSQQIALFSITGDVNAHLYKAEKHLTIRFIGTEAVENCEILLELDGSILTTDGAPRLTYPSMPVNIAICSIWRVQKWLKDNPQK
jgi:hypothetical protein